jgi:hypothetical protein
LAAIGGDRYFQGVGNLESIAVRIDEETPAADWIAGISQPRMQTPLGSEYYATILTSLSGT